jgi:hypothetical protein
MMHNAHVVDYISAQREVISHRIACGSPSADKCYAMLCQRDYWQVSYAIEVLREYCDTHGHRLMAPWPQPDYHRGY